MPERGSMTPNLIINGDAENGLLGWEAEDGYPMPVVVEYGATDPSGNFPTLAQAGRPAPGRHLFAGGPGVQAASFLQYVDLAELLGRIVEGAEFHLEAYAGGFATQEDHVWVSYEWLATVPGDDGRPVARFAAGLLPKVTAADRGAQTGLLRTWVDGTVPTWATSLLVGVQFFRTEGDYNDGYVDGLSLTIG